MDSAMNAGCLVEKLNRYHALSKADRHRVNQLQQGLRTYAKKQVVLHPEAAIDELYIIRTGCMAGFSELENGRRLILDLYFPGDLVNLGNAFNPESTNGLLCIESVSVHPVPKQELGTLFTESPVLSTLLYAIALQENTVLLDRLKARSRMSGKQRVGLLLLQILARLRFLNQNDSKQFNLCMSQELMGDAVGLSSVYVSNMMKALVEDGWIQRHQRTIRILDEEAMSRFCNFKDRYGRLDISWIQGLTP